MRPEIVSFIGVIGSGKDFQAETLRKSGYVRIDFKDELLNMASDIAGYDVREDYDWFKENIVGIRRPSNRFQEAFAFTDKRDMLLSNPEIMTGRRLLTRLGTETMRKRDKDYWVKQFVAKAKATLADGHGVVNADCRFLNEVESILDIPVASQFRFCNYRSERYNPVLAHASERLAQALLRNGMKDMHVIRAEDFARAADVLGEKFARERV